MKILSKATINARNLRKNQTLPEGLVWQQLRAKLFYGIKFRRQQPIGNFIVDFVSYEKKLIIEIDGGQHNDAKDKQYDKQRSNFLEGLGYTVLRFWNNEVITNLDGVLETIRLAIIHPHPTLS